MFIKSFYNYLINETINNKFFDNENKYEVGDTVLLKNDNRLGVVVRIINNYSIISSYFVLVDNNLHILRGNEIIRKIDDEEIRKIKNIHKEIDPYGEENWEY